MIDVNNCPVCGASSFKTVFSAPYFRGNGEEFLIQECDICELWVTSPRPEDEELGQYYDTGEYISHTNKKEGLIDHLYHLVREISLKRKVALINSCVLDRGRLLDYGAGTGHFIAAAKKAGWKVSGVEPSEEARKVAKARNDLELEAPENFQWEASSLEIITLWHVLEHLPNLRDHMKKFSNALVPDGCLVVAVPNHESPDAKAYGSNWAALDVPLHLYHFKKKNVEDLGMSFGLKLEEVRNMPFDSFYVSMLSERIEKGRVNYWSAFKTALGSNLRGKRSKNMSSLIYILRKSQ